MNKQKEILEGTAYFSQLYSKIAASLKQSGVVGNNPSSLLSIQIPGVTVKTDLDPNDKKDQYYISNFLNVTLECSYVATTKAALVSDVYKLILDGKELAITKLTESEEQELKNAEEKLSLEEGKPTPEYMDYQLYKSKFYCAQDDLESAKTTEKNGGTKVPESVYKKFETAKLEWSTKGFKMDIEQALSVVEQLQSKERYLYWNNLNKKYNQYTEELENGSAFQFNTSIPEYKDWFKQELWTPFTFDEKDYEKQARSGGLGMPSRLCCFQKSKISSIDHLNKKGASSLDGVSPIPKPTPSYNLRHNPTHLFASWMETSPEKETPFTGDLEEYNFSCSFKRISIIRPWMDSNVFYSRIWRWSDMSIGYGIDISTGGSVAGNDPATGVMPILPTTALLGKDIKFTTSNAALINWFEIEFGQGKQIRFGPFRFTKGINSIIRSKRLYSLSSTSAPQLFGYISTIFPECPNPDLSLKWPS